jgi:hypothetical protein
MPEGRDDLHALREETMTLEQRIEDIYAAAFVTDDGARITGLHDRPMIAEAHANALRTLAAAVREEAIEECAKVCEEKASDFARDVMDSNGDFKWTGANACADALRALKERKI